MNPRLTAAERRRLEREERFAERKEFYQLLSMYGLALCGVIGFFFNLGFMHGEPIPVRVIAFLVSVAMMGKVTGEIFVESARAWRSGGGNE